LLVGMCANGEELLRLRPGQLFECELDRAAYDGLRDGLVEAYQEVEGNGGGGGGGGTGPDGRVLVQVQVFSNK